MKPTGYTAAEVCRALQADDHADSGWMHEAFTGKLLEPREVWLADARMWVRGSGRYVSGWDGDRYRAGEIGFFGAWRIRRALRRWSRRRG